MTELEQEKALHDYYRGQVDDLTALLERVKAERDNDAKYRKRYRDALLVRSKQLRETRTCLDNALAALREISGYVRAHLAGHDADPELKWALEQSDAAIAEIDSKIK